MGRYLLIIALTLASGCRKESSTVDVKPANPEERKTARNPEMDDFFVKWFKAHGHEDVVVDGDGVGVGNNTTRLRASLYGSKQHKDGSFVAEVQFTIQLPSRREITEFVAGAGKTEKQANDDALLSFMLTTFHVVYKGFINAE